METVAPADGLLDGRWQVGTILGRGAASDVYRGVDLSTGHPVAIKVLREGLGEAADAEAGRRFEREITTLEHLDHPAIVRPLGHGTTPDGRRYVVMERALGGTLAGLLAAGPLEVDEAVTLGATLAGALDHAHARGIVHRDVKPANVLLDGEGRAQLGDFGIARLVGSAAVTATGWALGTPAYLAPEQVRGEPAGPPADVYALGLIVLEAITGVRAYEGSGVAAAVARLEHRPVIPDSVPPGVAAAIDAMTADDPADRPTAAGAGSRLEAVVDAGSTMAIPVAGLATTAIETAPPAPVAPTAPRGAAPAPLPFPPPPRRGRKVLLAVACFFAAFLLVTAVRAAITDGDGLGTPVETVESTTTIATTTTAPPTTTTETTEPAGHGRDKPGHGHGRDD